MYLEIDAMERAIAEKACELGEKKCDAVRDKVGELLVDDLEVRVLQGRIGTVRRDLADLKRDAFDWTFEQRRALGICLRLYSDKVKDVAGAQAKLLIDGEKTDERYSELRALLERLSGQESLFRARPLDDATVTLEANGESIEMTGEQLRRAADRVVAEGLAR